MPSIWIVGDWPTCGGTWPTYIVRLMDDRGRVVVQGAYNRAEKTKILVRIHLVCRKLAPLSCYASRTGRGIDDRRRVIGRVVAIRAGVVNLSAIASKSLLKCASVMTFCCTSGPTDDVDVDDSNLARPRSPSTSRRIDSSRWYLPASAIWFRQDILVTRVATNGFCCEAEH